MKKTTLRQNVKNEERQWWIIDAEGKVLGDLSTRVAEVLRGKHRADFTPHTDCGDYVVVLNAEKIQVTRNKEEGKTYHSHSRHLGHLKTKNLAKVRATQPKKILEHSIQGMLPHTKLRSAQMKRLRLVLGNKNTFEAQKPQPLKLK